MKTNFLKSVGKNEMFKIFMVERSVSAWSLFLIIAFGFLLGGCKFHEESDTIVIYAAGPRSLAESMCQDFEKQSGLHTKLYSATTGEIMAKLQAEQNQTQADVVILASPTAVDVLKDQEMLAPLPQGLPVRPEWTDKDGYYTGTSACALGIAMRKDHYDPNLEWTDFFSGAYQGSIIMPSPTESGTSGEFAIAFQLALGEKFWQGLKDAKKRGMEISGSNNQALTGLILGTHDAVLPSADYLVFKQIAKGESLVMHFPSQGCPVIPRPIAILKGAHNPKGAESFVRYVFTGSAQQLTVAEYLIPSDPGVPWSPVRSAGEKIVPMPYDVALAKKEQQEVLRRFHAEIEQSQ